MVIKAKKMTAQLEHVARMKEKVIRTKFLSEVPMESHY
jgi:hypothetical protein